VPRPSYARGPERRWFPAMRYDRSRPKTKKNNTASEFTMMTGDNGAFRSSFRSAPCLIDGPDTDLY
jgi:hypothetical protein